jgi:carbon storage regulator
VVRHWYKSRFAHRLDAMLNGDCRNVLILTRRVGERIRIGGDIVLTVLGVSGRSVKFGIEAPEACRVLREELYRIGWAKAPDSDGGKSVV